MAKVRSRRLVIDASIAGPLAIVLCIPLHGIAVSSFRSFSRSVTVL